MNPRDLPEVAAIIIEMHEVRLETNALNGRADQLKRVVENDFRELRKEQRSMRAESQAFTQMAAYSRHLLKLARKSC